MTNTERESIVSVDKDLATLHEWTYRIDAGRTVDRVEAELSRLREERDEQRSGRFVWRAEDGPLIRGDSNESTQAYRTQDEWRELVEAAEARCARLQQALAFYADEAHWRTASGVQWLGSPIWAFQDKGGRAREALAGPEENDA